MTNSSSSGEDAARREETTTETQPAADNQADTTDKNNDAAAEQAKSITAGVEIKAGNITAGGSVEIVAGDKEVTENFKDKNFITNIKNEFYKEVYRETEDFKLSDAEEVTAKEIDSLKRTFVEPDQLGEWQQLLAEKRILIISGEPDSGRFSTALYLSSREQETDPHFKIFRIYRLPSKKNLELDRFIRSKDYRCNSAWIIQDALEGENTFDVNFFSSLDTNELERLRLILKDKNSFVIFTIATTSSDHLYLSKIKFLIKTVAPINPLTLLKKHLVYLYHENLDAFPKEFNIDEFLNENQNAFNQLKRPDKIVNFARFFFRDVVSDKIKLAEALKKTNDPSIELKEWFGGLKSNDERWFVLALCFFNEFSWKRVWDVCLEIKSVCEGESAENQTNRKEAKNPFDVSDYELLTRARAKISDHPVTGSQMVSFVDPEHAELLLDFFIQNYRPVLQKIHSYLVALAEQREVIVRSRAAYILGRIGQIDFEKFVVPLIRHWADSERDYIKATVGHLFIGILETPREAYKKCALQALHELTDSKLLHQWTAVAICKQIGFKNLDLALEELRNIILRKKIESLLDFLEKEIEKEVIWPAIAYSLNALSVRYTPVQIILKLNQWFDHEDPQLHIVTLAAFMFADGIADTFAELAEKRKKDDDGEKTKGNHNEIIKILVRNNEILPEIIAFLGNVLATIEIRYEGDTRKYLQKRFMKILQEWSLDAYVTPEGRQMMHAIIVEIYKNPSELYDKLAKRNKKFSGQQVHELIKRQRNFIYEQLKKWGQKKDDQILKYFAEQLCNEIQAIETTVQVTNKNVIVKEQAMDERAPRRQVKTETGIIKAENVFIAGGHIISSAVWQPLTDDNLPDFEFIANGIKAKREFKLAAGHLVMGEHRIEEVIDTIIAEIKKLNKDSDIQRIVNTNLDSIKSQLSLGQHKDKGIIRLLWDKTKSALNGLATTSDLIQLFQILNTYLANLS